MNQDRRDFFRNIGTKTAGAVASVAAPAAIHAESLSNQIREASSSLTEKLTNTATELNEQLSNAATETQKQVRGLTNRIDTSALMLSYQQVQINIIFMLLILSFAIDGGMSFFWAFYG
ncbi:MAG: hypothetical protein HOF48_00820 [Gammaproteobacteria bacterium]|jgi:hypothetical protein|nr:hypothetical protein [Gammaproteobacteria bacterium]MBT5465060.1 hypothetical protein [Candidatus Neomarinimicrobiota bacterium]